jgi:exodeoxyribonuclease-3
LSDEIQHRPLLVAGDFNIAPTDDDVYDRAALEGATHVSEPERLALRGLLDLGLVDCGASAKDTDSNFTWWDYRQGAFRRGMGMRIDLVLASLPLSGEVRSFQVDRLARAAPKPSDHAPVIVEF